jgi:hypothetical protein
VSSVSSSARGRAVVVALGLAVAACDEEFPLGSWGLDAAAAGMAGMGAAGTSGGSSGAGSGAGMSGAGGSAGMIAEPSQPACGEVGAPDAFNTAGVSVGATTLSTDWYWPEPVDSLEWNLVIENETETNGYYWAHKFSWVGGLSGYFGLQAFGGYQVKPPSKLGASDGSSVTFEKMALFWVAGPPTAGELGDITGDDNARVAEVPEPGATFLTINAKFPWVPCDLYHLSVAKDMTDASGDVWYGAWIDDETTHVRTFIGRILIPASWGQLSPATSTYTQRIDNANQQKAPPVVTCSDLEPTSAIFGTPTANDGQILPVNRKNNFGTPLRCPTSRFTILPEGIRQEIGLPPTSQ